MGQGYRVHTRSRYMMCELYKKDILPGVGTDDFPRVET